MAIPSMPGKAADEVLDYKIDMTAELANRLANGSSDTITGVAWSLAAVLPSTDTSLVIGAHSNDDSTVTVWLSGGVLGDSYEVSAEMTTAGGRTYRRSFTLTIMDR